MNQLKRTFLHSYHKGVLMASIMGPFAGYDMPIEYKDLGILKESLHCRHHAVAFDVSHMGQVRVHGNDRLEFIEKMIVGDIAKLPEGGCSLSLVLNNRAVLNAGNKDKDFEHMQFLKQEYFSNKDVQFEKREDDSLIALQGPRASEALQSIVKTDLKNILFMQFFKEKPEGFNKEIVCYRLGYTGEDGFEIAVSNDDVENLMDMLFKNDFIKPAGLGARDTLRLESGLCLHGHEINDDITPVESLLQWTIRKKSNFTDFYGREAFLKRKKKPLDIKRVGLQLTKGGVLRENYKIFNQKKDEIGKLTSGTFSPILKSGIGMGYILKEYKEPGTELLIDIRGRKKEAKVVKLPFVPQRYYRGD